MLISKITVYILTVCALPWNLTNDVSMVRGIF